VGKRVGKGGGLDLDVFSGPRVTPLIVIVDALCDKLATVVREI